MVSHTIVNSSVGTAASTMPRRPPSALLSWARTTASTVSTEAAGAGAVGVRTDAVSRFAHGMSS